MIPCVAAKRSNLQRTQKKEKKLESNKNGGKYIQWKPFALDERGLELSTD
jgi:hypothetical protein